MFLNILNSYVHSLQLRALCCIYGIIDKMYVQYIICTYSFLEVLYAQFSTMYLVLSAIHICCIVGKMCEYVF